MQKMRIGIILALSILTVTPLFAESPVLLADKEETLLARVVAVIDSEMRNVPNTETQALYQKVTIRFLKDGATGKEITVQDTSFPMKVGDKVYVRHITTSDNMEYYSIMEPYRIPALLYLFAFFFVAVLLFGGKKGFLSLLALFISFGVIFKILFPQIIHGGNSIILATVGALASLFVVMFLTHGFTRLTTAAFLGCTASVLATVVLASLAVHMTALTGFSDEESVFLNIATKGGLDFVALLVGGIIIGVIGVIDDVAITQASVVHELRHANHNLTARELYIKASAVGKNHMGAVINTLILAYTGASLPLVLLLYVSDTSAIELINREAIATEIVRSCVGSVGLLLAVPLTTIIAIMLMKHETYVEEISTRVVAHTHHH
jgi:uncharacterized membrane protein